MAFGQAPPAFGAPSSGFSFGAPAASNPNPFGGSNTPAFGASSTPAFGAPAASSPSLFGASSTPAFGATPTPAFGTSTFGASPSAFGTPSTPAFGTAGATPSLFGASTSTAAPSAGGAFSFPAASSAAAASGASFGSFFTAPAGSTAAPAGGVFGQPAAPATGANMFGAVTTTTQQQQQQQQQLQQQQQQQGTQLSPLAYSSGSHEAVKRELEAVATAYMPQHTSFKFQHLFLNVVDNPAQRVKPPQVVDELSWKQALRDAGGPDNPDRLWPVPGSGFEDLLKRGQAQAQALAENRQRLDALRDVAHKLAQRQATEVAVRVAAARAAHVELAGRLLAVARHVDGLEGRLGSVMGMRGELSRGKEAALSRALEVIEAQLSHTSPAGLQRRLDALAAACRLRATSGGLGIGSAGQVEQGSTRLDEASLHQLFGVLKEHVEGLKQLQEVLRRDTLDVEIMRGVRQDGSVVPAAVNIAAVEYI